MLVVQPSGGSASQPILGLGRVACGGGRPGRHANGALRRYWREFPALAVAVLSSLARDSDVSGEDLYYRAGPDYPRVFRVPARQPRSRKPEDRPVFRGPLVGQNATRGRTALPLHLREGDEACTTLLSCPRSARGIPPLLPSVIPAHRSPESGSPEPRRPIVPMISWQRSSSGMTGWRATPSPARASREPPIGQDARPSG